MKDLFLYLKQLLEDNELKLSMGLPNFEEQQKDNPLYVATFDKHVTETDLCNIVHNKVDVLIGCVSQNYDATDETSYLDNLERLEFVKQLILEDLKLPKTFGNIRIMAVHNHLIRDVGLDNALRFLTELVVTISWQ